MPYFILSTTPVQEFEGHHGSVSSVGVLPDQRRMVTGSEDKILRLWDIKRGVILKKMERHSVVILVLVISRDGKVIASGGKNGELIVWDGDTGEPLTGVIKSHTDWIPSLDFSPNDKILASGSHDETVRLWNTKTWQLEGLIECDASNHSRGIRAIALNSNGTLIAFASEDNHVRLWRLSDRQKIAVLKHSNEVHCVTFSTDGRHIFSGGADNKILKWQILDEIYKLAKKDQKAPGHWHFGMISMDFSPSGAVLATASMDQKAKLWDTKTWQLQGRPITCHDRVFCVRYSPSGERLAIATASIIEIYHPGTRHRVAKFSSHGSYNCSLTWTPDGTGLLSSGNYEDPTIREWDASTWEQVGDAWMGHTNDVNVIAIHPAGTLVASASDDKQVRLWRLSDGHTISIFQHSDRVCCVTFSVDGEHILSGGDDEKISEWAVPKDASSKDAPKSKVFSHCYPARAVLVYHLVLPSFYFKAQSVDLKACFHH
ncbi:WD40 repeat-like protein [Suillus hirtellus]|nr:WD40 repeat-like protein [Suillus hirtellus]